MAYPNDPNDPRNKEQQQAIPPPMGGMGGMPEGDDQLQAMFDMNARTFEKIGFAASQFESFAENIGRINTQFEKFGDTITESLDRMNMGRPVKESITTAGASQKVSYNPIKNELDLVTQMAELKKNQQLGKGSVVSHYAEQGNLDPREVAKVFERGASGSIEGLSSELRRNLNEYIRKPSPSAERMARLGEPPEKGMGEYYDMYKRKMASESTPTQRQPSGSIPYVDVLDKQRATPTESQAGRLSALTQIEEKLAMSGGKGGGPGGGGGGRDTGGIPSGHSMSGMSGRGNFDMMQSLEMMNPMSPMSLGWLGMFALTGQLWSVAMPLAEPPQYGLEYQKQMMRGPADFGASFTGLGSLSKQYQQLAGTDAFELYEAMFSSFTVLKNVYKSQEKASGSISQSIELARQTPLEVSDLLKIFSTFAVNPELRGVLSNKEQMGQLATGVSGLSFLVPEQGTQGAIFSIREALAGQFRSMKMRFNINPEMIATAGGMSMEEMRQKPTNFLGALDSFLKQNLGQNTFTELQMTFSKQVGNIMDAMTGGIFKAFQGSKMYESVTGFSYEIGNVVSKYFDSDTFSGFFTEFSGKVSSQFHRAQNVLQNMDFESDTPEELQNKMTKVGTLITTDLMKAVLPETEGVIKAVTPMAKQVGKMVSQFLSVGLADVVSGALGMGIQSLVRTFTMPLQALGQPGERVQQAVMGTVGEFAVENPFTTLLAGTMGSQAGIKAIHRIRETQGGVSQAIFNKLGVGEAMTATPYLGGAIKGGLFGAAMAGFSIYDLYKSFKATPDKTPDFDKMRESLQKGYTTLPEHFQKMVSIYEQEYPYKKEVGLTGSMLDAASMGLMGGMLGRTFAQRLTPGYDKMFRSVYNTPEVIKMSEPARTLAAEQLDKTPLTKASNFIKAKEAEILQRSLSEPKFNKALNEAALTPYRQAEMLYMPFTTIPKGGVPLEPRFSKVIQPMISQAESIRQQNELLVSKGLEPTPIRPYEENIRVPIGERYQYETPSTRQDRTKNWLTNKVITSPTTTMIGAAALGAAAGAIPAMFGEYSLSKEDFGTYKKLSAGTDVLSQVGSATTMMGLMTGNIPLGVAGMAIAGLGIAGKVGTEAYYSGKSNKQEEEQRKKASIEINKSNKDIAEVLKDMTDPRKSIKEITDISKLTNITEMLNTPWGYVVDTMLGGLKTTKEISPEAQTTLKKDLQQAVKKYIDDPEKFIEGIENIKEFIIGNTSLTERDLKDIKEDSLPRLKAIALGLYGEAVQTQRTALPKQAEARRTLNAADLIKEIPGLKEAVDTKNVFGESTFKKAVNIQEGTFGVAEVENQMGVLYDFVQRNIADQLVKTKGMGLKKADEYAATIMDKFTKKGEITKAFAAIKEYTMEPKEFMQEKVFGFSATKDMFGEIGNVVNPDQMIKYYTQTSEDVLTKDMLFNTREGPSPQPIRPPAGIGAYITHQMLRRAPEIVPFGAGVEISTKMLDQYAKAAEYESNKVVNLPERIATTAEELKNNFTSFNKAMQGMGIKQAISNYNVGIQNITNDIVKGEEKLESMTLKEYRKAVGDINIDEKPKAIKDVDVRAQAMMTQAKRSDTLDAYFKERPWITQEEQVERRKNLEVLSIEGKRLLGGEPSIPDIRNFSNVIPNIIQQMTLGQVEKRISTIGNLYEGFNVAEKQTLGMYGQMLGGREQQLQGTPFKLGYTQTSGGLMPNMTNIGGYQSENPDIQKFNFDAMQRSTLSGETLEKTNLLTKKSGDSLLKSYSSVLGAMEQMKGGVSPEDQRKQSPLQVGQLGKLAKLYETTTGEPVPGALRGRQLVEEGQIRAGLVKDYEEKVLPHLQPGGSMEKAQTEMKALMDRAFELDPEGKALKQLSDTADTAANQLMVLKDAAEQLANMLNAITGKGGGTGATETKEAKDQQVREAAAQNARLVGDNKRAEEIITGGKLTAAESTTAVKQVEDANRKAIQDYIYQNATPERKAQLETGTSVLTAKELSAAEQQIYTKGNPTQYNQINEPISASAFNDAIANLDQTRAFQLSQGAEPTPEEAKRAQAKPEVQAKQTGISEPVTRSAYLDAVDRGDLVRADEIARYKPLTDVEREKAQSRPEVREEQIGAPPVNAYDPYRGSITPTSYTPNGENNRLGFRTENINGINVVTNDTALGEQVRAKTKEFAKEHSQVVGKTLTDIEMNDLNMMISRSQLSGDTVGSKAIGIYHPNKNKIQLGEGKSQLESSLSPGELISHELGHSLYAYYTNQEKGVGGKMVAGTSLNIKDIMEATMGSDVMMGAPVSAYAESYRDEGGFGFATERFAELFKDRPAYKSKLSPNIVSNKPLEYRQQSMIDFEDWARKNKFEYGAGETDPMTKMTAPQRELYNNQLNQQMEKGLGVSQLKSGIKPVTSPLADIIDELNQPINMSVPSVESIFNTNAENMFTPNVTTPTEPVPVKVVDQGAQAYSPRVDIGTGYINKQEEEGTKFTNNIANINKSLTKTTEVFGGEKPFNLDDLISTKNELEPTYPTLPPDRAADLMGLGFNNSYDMLVRAYDAYKSPTGGSTIMAQNAAEASSPEDILKQLQGFRDGDAKKAADAAAREAEKSKTWGDSLKGFIFNTPGGKAIKDRDQQIQEGIDKGMGKTSSLEDARNNDMLVFTNISGATTMSDAGLEIFKAKELNSLTKSYNNVASMTRPASTDVNQVNTLVKSFEAVTGELVGGIISPEQVARAEASKNPEPKDRNELLMEQLAEYNKGKPMPPDIQLGTIPMGEPIVLDEAKSMEFLGLIRDVKLDAVKAEQNRFVPLSIQDPDRYKNIPFRIPQFNTPEEKQEYEKNLNNYMTAKYGEYKPTESNGYNVIAPQQTATRSTNAEPVPVTIVDQNIAPTNQFMLSPDRMIEAISPVIKSLETILSPDRAAEVNKISPVIKSLKTILSPDRAAEKLEDDKRFKLPFGVIPNQEWSRTYGGAVPSNEPQRIESAIMDWGKVIDRGREIGLGKYEEEPSGATFLKMIAPEDTGISGESGFIETFKPIIKEMTKGLNEYEEPSGATFLKMIAPEDTGIPSESGFYEAFKPIVKEVLKLAPADTGIPSESGFYEAFKPIAKAILSIGPTDTGIPSEVSFMPTEQEKKSYEFLSSKYLSNQPIGESGISGDKADIYALDTSQIAPTNQFMQSPDRVADLMGIGVPNNDIYNMLAKTYDSYKSPTGGLMVAQNAAEASSPEEILKQLQGFRDDDANKAAKEAEKPKTQGDSLKEYILGTPGGKAITDRDKQIQEGIDKGMGKTSSLEDARNMSASNLFGPTSISDAYPQMFGEKPISVLDSISPFSSDQGIMQTSYFDNLNNIPNQFGGSLLGERPTSALGEITAFTRQDQEMESPLGNLSMDADSVASAFNSLQQSAAATADALRSAGNGMGISGPATTLMETPIAA